MISSKLVRMNNSKIFIDNLFEEDTNETSFELKTPIRPKTPPSAF